MGTSSGKHSHINHIGIGSSSHDLLVDFEIFSVTSFSDAGVNSRNCSLEFFMSNVSESDFV